MKLINPFTFCHASYLSAGGRQQLPRRKGFGRGRKRVSPIFAIGASLGGVLGAWFGIPVEFLAAIGYCAVFASSTNTFLASFLIGIEIFGYNMAGYLFIACAMAYLFSGELSIYEGQKKGHLKI